MGRTTYGYYTYVDLRHAILARSLAPLSLSLPLARDADS